MAFHPYPQVIRNVFSRWRFGPPQGFTLASTCSWIDHPVSGLIRTTCALFRLAFTTAPLSLNLAVQINSLTHYAKGTRLPHMGALAACEHLVSDSVSLPSQGFFSPFPHGTGSLSVVGEYLALEDGPPGFPRGSTCLAVLRYRLRRFRFRVRGCHPLWRSFPASFPCLLANRVWRPCNPGRTNPAGLGSSPFARRY